MKNKRVRNLFFLNIAVVLFLSYVYPVWIYDCFFFARELASIFFPAQYAPLPVVPVTPVIWI